MGIYFTRIVWNTLEWTQPSGLEGKDSNLKLAKPSYEAMTNFGHEEWLLDHHLVDGYQYGFLQGYAFKIDKKRQDVYLISKCFDNSKYYLVGIIKNLMMINNEEAEYVKNTYIKNGWLQEREDQLKEIGIDLVKVSTNPKLLKIRGAHLTENLKKVELWDARDQLFNVKFKLEDVLIKPFMLSPGIQNALHADYRRFKRYKKAHIVSLLGSNEGFKFEPKDDIISPESLGNYEKVFEGSILVLEKTHRKLQAKIQQYLIRKFGPGILRVEQPSPAYSKGCIDLMAVINNIRIIYEVKTYNDVRRSIRLAIGQLLEYSFESGAPIADKFCIVTQRPLSEEDVAYLNYLKSVYNIPLQYMYFSLDSDEPSYIYE